MQSDLGFRCPDVPPYDALQIYRRNDGPAKVNESDLNKTRINCCWKQCIRNGHFPVDRHPPLTRK